ncbi:MAG: orange carotenoid protein N-terminal domain-containing protein [Leptolyngbyaceae cyanobacterium]
MIATRLNPTSDSIFDRFLTASPATQLMVLRSVVEKIHQASSTATPSALFSQKVQSVLRLLQQLPRDERHQALEEILQDVDTRLTEAYRDLDSNMKVAFWYRLASDRHSQNLLSDVQTSPWNHEQQRLLNELESRDSNELITFLHRVIAG